MRSELHGFGTVVGTQERKFQQCSNPRCRKVGFSEEDTLCRCGASLEGTSLPVILSRMLLRKTSPDFDSRAKGFKSYSAWAQELGIPYPVFKAHAAAVVAEDVERVLGQHRMKSAGDQKHHYCDAHFSEIVRARVLSNKKMRRGTRLSRYARAIQAGAETLV